MSSAAATGDPPTLQPRDRAAGGLTTFDQVWPVILAHEGARFTNDPADPGGPTKYGITLGWAREQHLDIDRDGDVDELDVRALTEGEAKAAYRAWFQALGYDQLRDPLVATKAFDLVVNMGPSRGGRYLQRALNLLGFNLREDGKVGRLTLEAANASRPAALVRELSFLQETHYRHWLAADPARQRFSRGLLSRAAWPSTLGDLA